MIWLRTSLILLAAVTAVMLCVVLTTYNITTTYVSGNSIYSDEETAQIFEQGFFGNNAAVLSLRYNQQAVDIPFIEKVDVIYLDSHTVQINVIEKDIAARIEADNGMYIYVNSSGVVQEITSEYVDKYPTEVGLAVTSAEKGSELTAENSGDYLYLCSVMQLLEKYEFAADKISVHPESGIDLKFGDVTVKLGNNENTNLKLSTLRTLVPYLDDRSGTIDLSNYTTSSEYVVLK